MHKGKSCLSFQSNSLALQSNFQEEKRKKKTKPQKNVVDTGTFCLSWSVTRHNWSTLGGKHISLSRPQAPESSRMAMAYRSSLSLCHHNTKIFQHFTVPLWKQGKWQTLLCPSFTTLRKKKDQTLWLVSTLEQEKYLNTALVFHGKERIYYYWNTRLSPQAGSCCLPKFPNLPPGNEPWGESSHLSSPYISTHQTGTA